MKQENPKTKRFFDYPVPPYPTPINNNFYNVLVKKHGEALVKNYYRPKW